MASHADDCCTDADAQEQDEMDTKFPLRIVGNGTSARNRDLLVHFWIVSNQDHSEALYTDTLYEGEWWDCESTTADVRAFFEETPTYPTELASLKIIVGPADKPLGIWAKDASASTCSPNSCPMDRPSFPRRRGT
jgi:hypothetical protein